MKLEDIGFYTLSDDRALNASVHTPLKRCELILTDSCNFKCKYCRPLRDDIKGTMNFEKAMQVLNYWVSQGLENVRFSGGEPTLYKRLPDLVKFCADHGVQHIAVSTNGSSSQELYQKLIDAGVNDFSVSLDGGCCSTGDMMTGLSTPGIWETVVENIRFLSERTYCSLGMVFTESNVEECLESVVFADSLGVADIRVIPSAQYNQALSKLARLPEHILDKYPILRYRIDNIVSGKHVRGIEKKDSDACWLALDDMAVAGDFHFPCIIYMREQGEPVGKVGPNMRQERLEWIQKHNPKTDPICKKNCLDVCVAYNNVASQTHEKD